MLLGWTGGDGGGGVVSPWRFVGREGRGGGGTDWLRFLDGVVGGARTASVVVLWSLGCSEE